jgi:hypothetical protein
MTADGSSALLAAIAAVVGCRLLWNGIGVRIIGFLGDTWWKLPATIFGALTAMWALTQLLLRQGVFGSH